MSSKRSSYHSDLKIAFKLGIIPQEITLRVPRSTRYRFVHTDFSSLVGPEYSKLLDDLELFKWISAAKERLSFASCAFRIISALRKLDLSFSSLKKVKSPAIRTLIVQRINTAARFVPLGKILSFLGVSFRRFKAWKSGKLPCFSSPLGICRSSNPGQLSVVEVKRIRMAFRDPSTAHWPAISIAWKLIHSCQVKANVSTIIRHAKAMGLLAARKLAHKSHKRGSVTAIRPNEIWHLDATFIRTQDGIKAAIQFVMDNYSRKIIAFAVSLAINGANTVKLLREACATLPCSQAEPTILISDGGPENVNGQVEEFVKAVPLKHLLVQTDVIFSNSMIEAANKTLKYRYLFRFVIPDYSALPVAMGNAVVDYNARPHYASKGLTPNQVQAGVVFDTEAYRQALARAHLERIKQNRHSCPPCIPLEEENNTAIA
jgi:transposase InsO family protein